MYANVVHFVIALGSIGAAFGGVLYFEPQSSNVVCYTCSVDIAYCRLILRLQMKIMLRGFARSISSAMFLLKTEKVGLTSNKDYTETAFCCCRTATVKR